jgi:hypothetical protein
MDQQHAVSDSGLEPESGWLLVDEHNGSVTGQTDAFEIDAVDAMSWPSLQSLGSVMSSRDRASSFGSEFSFVSAPILATDLLAGADESMCSSSNISISRTFAQVVQESTISRIESRFVLRTTTMSSTTRPKRVERARKSLGMGRGADNTMLVNREIESRLTLRADRFDEQSRHFGLDGARGFRRGFCTWYHCYNQLEIEHDRSEIMNNLSIIITVCEYCASNSNNKESHQPHHSP